MPGKAGNKKIKNKNNKKKSSLEKSSAASSDGNRPRNLMILDATTPVIFSYPKYGKPLRIEIKQTNAEETWPGGALWDLGWLMAQFLVSTQPNITETFTTSSGSTRKRPILRHSFRFKPNVILELGCGVGLTGLVAHDLYQPKLTILTDLRVVVEQVTRCNLKSPVVAEALEWGNEEDISIVKKLMETRAKQRTPDLILLGDVAYQHRPGAPSHFDALVSTIQKMISPSTILVFGLRIRMPASHDLLDLLLEDFDELERIPAESINPQDFDGLKHNMSIHMLKPKVSRLAE